MKKLGVKQQLVIDECIANDFVWTGDIIDIFNISPKKSKRALIELKKLVIYGYLEQIDTDERYFCLTKKAKKHYNLE